jgi:hypothetical protein
VLAAIGDFIGVVAGGAVGTEAGVDVVAAGDFECTIGAIEIGLPVEECGAATGTFDGAALP